MPKFSKDENIEKLTERVEYARKLRAEGLPFSHIGRKLGVSSVMAYKYVSDSNILKRLNEPPIFAKDTYSELRKIATILKKAESHIGEDEIGYLLFCIARGFNQPKWCRRYIRNFMDELKV